MYSQMKEKSKQSSMWSMDSATSGGPASGGSKWSVSKVHAWLKYDLCSSGVPVFGVTFSWITNKNGIHLRECSFLYS